MKRTDLILIFLLINANSFTQYADISAINRFQSDMNLYILKNQNYVKNPGFETYSHCPINYTIQPKSYFVDNWTMPTIGTPDYFNACSHQAGVPPNWSGFLPAHSGEGYMGMISGMYNKHKNRTDYREYIQGEFDTTLTAGRLYYISFYTALAKNSRFAIDGMGAFLSTAIIDTLNFIETLKVEPQLKNQQGKIIRNTSSWIEISGLYKAKGNEKTIIIGNFVSDNRLKWELINQRGTLNYAYMLVDDVRVCPVDTTYPEYKGLLDYYEYRYQNKPLFAGNILFETEKYQLLESYFNQLNELVIFLKANPSAMIELSGHCDNTGEEVFNDELSVLRAKEVAEFLIFRDIDKSRIRISGYGEKKPTADNKSKEGRMKNRRVEITIINPDYSGILVNDF